MTFLRHLGKAYTKFDPMASSKRAECSLRVLSLLQWRFVRNFEPLVSHTNVQAG